MKPVSNAEKSGKTLPAVRTAVHIDETPIQVTGGKLAEGE